ncbi:hypothetical protein K450DRAFT_231432 [Umbelopsis ramanniana AG]|uniref:Chromatin modification-related protein n=1 Tax=Umbelopsis ramanniana AG TaxID=1314678 RepID=A0AAD5EE08_UMBRA|nr:uncharacterized protein K450DRAFT_231432 [Umbelopsis ramanniana AG]KAI8581464.1 hypothetical protein K450DRAFT_231432 [Umbelopsis ramanniana AG]
MSVSIADLFEDYLETLHNLPSEMDQNMHELRTMDEEFQKLRETYTKHRRSYTKQTRPTANSPASTPVSPSPPPINLVASRLQIEKEYKVAMQKQDNKIDLAMRMYDLISRHIERLDSQITKSGVSGVDWIGTKKEAPSNDKLFMDHVNEMNAGLTHKRPHGLVPSSSRKRTAHSSRPNPNQAGSDGVPDLDIDPNEPTYCYCNQVSFGDMVACDSESCEREWFHYQCVGLVEPPAGKWYCDDCLEDMNMRKRMRRSPSSVSFN